jgi:hypothetical protein
MSSISFISILISVFFTFSYLGLSAELTLVLVLCFRRAKRSDTLEIIQVLYLCIHGVDVSVHVTVIILELGIPIFLLSTEGLCIF